MAEEVTSSARPIEELCESVKITKNSKGFNYEFTCRTKGAQIIDDNFLKRVNDINNKLMTVYGSE